MSDIHIPLGPITLDGILEIPKDSKALVIFAHGSGSSRFSERNTFVANVLQEAGIATLLFDLLTEEEDQVYETRFNIPLLTERLKGATQWIMKQPKTKKLKIGYFGASTGAAAALEAAADPKLQDVIKAVVSRGGRPDMAIPVLPQVKSPTLLIVGGNDFGVIELNQQAYDALKSEKKLEIVPGATHLFEESGTLEQVAELARQWFLKYLESL